MVEKELLGVMKENLDKDATRGKKDVDCCCPSFIFFIFEEVNCAQIFNGACEDWRPGSPLVKNVYK
ncbi:MAG TPA: hypothetical protein PKM06_05945 [Bacillota bacterium]|nr:hypothetical protein [Peptococcaceae bacterium MAG4]NLW38117.1 hypothetical protein [Peptococcaceae bacterium]HQD76062.1 hypothetical protein [Bacillota bacterium]HUM58751.1 hypothetical protein [Bacillota bacterium]